MAPETCYKDPTEIKFFTVLFRRRLNQGATIVSIVSIVSDPAITIANNAIAADGLSISTKISGGTVGDYVVTAIVVSSDGETLEESGRLRVKASTS